jgi:PPOX class probable F420-dependent enzyme
MPGLQLTIDGRDQEQAGGGYFTAVERAGHMMLTAFERGGGAVSAPVGGVADGDRAYCWAWSGSGGARLLRHAVAVQVMPCIGRGFVTYGLPISVTARLLPGDEAGQAIGKLARRHPVQHRVLIPLLQRVRRRQMVVYELVADDAQSQRGDLSREDALRASREVARVHCARTRVAQYGASSVACIWAVPFPPARQAARQAP